MCLDFAFKKYCVTDYAKFIRFLVAGRGHVFAELGAKAWSNSNWCWHISDGSQVIWQTHAERSCGCGSQWIRKQYLNGIL